MGAGAQGRVRGYTVMGKRQRAAEGVSGRNRGGYPATSEMKPDVLREKGRLMSRASQKRFMVERSTWNSLASSA